MASKDDSYLAFRWEIYTYRNNGEVWVRGGDLKPIGHWKVEDGRMLVKTDGIGFEWEEVRPMLAEAFSHWIASLVTL